MKYESCESVIAYINQIKRVGNGGNNINIIMDDIVEIGEGAIAMLLSVMQELVQKGIIFKGSKPSNSQAKDILERSGFFKFVIGRVNENNSSTKNTILQTGDNKTSYDELSKAIVSAMDTVWGSEGRSPSVYGSVFEMMRNSCDHAFRHEYQIIWHFAISHFESENTVKFSFVDNGKGIIKTFADGILKKFLNLFQNNLDIVETAFKDGIASKTGLKWRGKGLPTIFENYRDNNIKNLVIITNDVYIDFDREIRHSLKKKFSGTYYYWKVDRECIKECFKLIK